MTPDDILRLAREADLIDFRDAPTDPYIKDLKEPLLHFADLVAAAERERIAAHYEAQPHVEFFGLELADA